MKYIKIFFILLLIWPRIWYTKVAGKAEEKWRKGGEIPPQYSKETKKLIKKQKRAKRWAMIMSIIPFGPISLFVTWLSFRHEKERTIEFYVSQQIPEVEEFKENRRKRRETLIKYLEEKFKLESDINWENVMIPNLKEEDKLKELLFGENGILTKFPEKNKNNKKQEYEEEIEELNI